MFGKASDATMQKAAIRWIKVWKYGSDELLFSCWPDPKNGGMIDLISGKQYQPSNGSLKIVKLEDM